MLLKYFYFILYSIAVVFFMYFIKLSYLFNFYYDVLFCNFKNESRYDYIIVGAGSAGSVLAAKLSNAGAETLLVEAGGPPTYFLDIPIIAPMLMNSVYDWRYKTVPQQHACKALDNNQSIWTAGKILGGSSRLNYMVYSLGHQNDYKDWFNDFQEPIVESGGTLYVNDKWCSKITDTILQGVTELSHQVIKFNNSITAGFTRAYSTIKNGKRWSTDKIINQNSNRRLKTLTHSFVTKILFKSNKAVGVEFIRGYNIYKAFAKKGVIISAGAIGTPKLLMLSGIGPKKHLEEFNIKAIVDLPVGQNLIDHIITGLDLVTLKKNVAMSTADILSVYSLVEYYLLGKGPWTSSGVDVIGTFHSKFNKNKESVPDLQIMTIPVGISQDNGILFRKNFGVSEKIFNKYFLPLVYNTTITIAPVLLHPKSSGEVKLKSANPFDPPVINPKYLSNEKDVLTLIEGIKFVKKLIETKAMKTIGASIYEKQFPGCEEYFFDTEDYWKCYIKFMTFSTYHPAGTSSMGKVVNSEFRVYNTKNLFVVDASVFPNLPSGNINAPVIMIAEKASGIFIESFRGHKNEKNKCYKKDVLLLISFCY